jgi:hypothetical protein
MVEYSGELRFGSRSGDWLLYLIFLWFYSFILGILGDSTLKIGHDCLLPHSFQLITH